MPIFLDSPLAIKLTSVYQKHNKYFNEAARSLISNGDNIFSFPGLTLTIETAESKSILRTENPKIVIAGSGMCTGGRIRHHLRYNISRAGNQILIVGFQARGTTGRMLVDGARTINLFGDSHNVNATVHTVGGLSAHADHQGLIDWYNHFADQPPVQLVHGEEDAMDVLKAALERRFQADVGIADYHQTLRL